MRPFFTKRPVRNVSFFLLAMVLTAACTKTNTVIVDSLKKPVIGRDLRDTLIDTVKSWYLWNNLIPSSFNAHDYSLSDTFTQEINAIKSFSPVNAGLSPDAHGNAVHDDQDGFSRVETESSYQAEQNGTSYSYGMYFEFAEDSNLYVSQVDHASPAYANGVRKGWRVTQINLTPVSYTDGFVNAFNTALNSSQVEFLFNDALSNPVRFVINQAQFGADEVNFANVLQSGGKTIGYISYNSFYTQLRSDLSGGSHPGLDSAFSDFKNKGVTDVIVDFRNNGGGYVNVATEMCNALISPANDGQLMFTENYNNSLTAQFQTQLPVKNLVNRSDKNNPPLLNINNIVFIVNNNTASASELVINNLLPFNANVKIIGNWKNDRSFYQHTRGKPFGGSFFQFPTINPQYAMYLLMDESKNAIGQDNYVAGFKADLATASGLQYDWGNPNEPSYAAAVNYLVTGNLADVARRNLTLSGLRQRIAFGGVLDLQLNHKIHNRFAQHPGLISLTGRGTVLGKLMASYRTRKRLSIYQTK